MRNHLVYVYWECNTNIGGYYPVIAIGGVGLFKWCGGNLQSYTLQVRPFTVIVRWLSLPPARMRESHQALLSRIQLSLKAYGPRLSLAATLRVIAIQDYIIALVFIATKLLYDIYANLQSTSNTPVQSTIIDNISIHQRYHKYLPVLLKPCPFFTCQLVG